jgi:hypothetical protein
MDNDKRIAYLAGDLSTPIDPAERAELDELRGLLTDPAVWVEPHPDLQERIVGAIADAGNAQRMQLSEDSAPTAAPVDIAGGTHRRSLLIPLVVLAVAAAVLLAVGLAVGLNTNGSRSVEYAASLSGTKLAPGASGQVTLSQTTSGWKIRLHATGLPRLDNGAYYEAWLKNSGGVLVPIGTFNQADDVTLWAGVPPSSYPTLTVTRQLANGGQSSSGQVALLGTTHRTN